MSVTVKVFNSKTGTFDIPPVIIINKKTSIDNMKGYLRVNVMQPSILSNGCELSEQPREEAVKVHEVWFREEMRNEKSEVKKKILLLAQKVANGQNIALICYCKSGVSHAVIIADAITGYSKKLNKIS